MKKFWKEILILIIQVFLFYILPLFAGPADIMGLFLILIGGTFILSIISGISKEKVKYFYPLVVSILFLPSIFIYYNENFFIYIVWYFVVSLIGLVMGIIIYLIINKLIKKSTNK